MWLRNAMKNVKKNLKKNVDENLKEIVCTISIFLLKKEKNMLRLLVTIIVGHFFMRF